MSAVLLLIYSNTFLTILFSISLGYLLAILVRRITKVKNIFPTVLSSSLIIYLLTMFSPIPTPIERQIIQMIGLLDSNMVESNRTLNAVLIPCMDMQLKGVKGFQVQDIRDDFITDMQEHLNKSGMFHGEKIDEKILSSDLCEAAWKYNDIKNTRYKVTQSQNTKLIKQDSKSES